MCARGLGRARTSGLGLMPIYGGCRPRRYCGTPEAGDRRRTWPRRTRPGCSIVILMSERWLEIRCPWLSDFTDWLLH